MKMKIKLSICAILFFCLQNFAQQDIYFTSAIENFYLLNPAAGGLNGYGEISAGNRTQWMGVNDNPETFYASGQSLIRFNKSATPNVLSEVTKSASKIYSDGNRTLGRKHVLGGKVLIDQIGPFKTTQFSGSYAIHLPINSKLNMGVGLGMGMRSFGIDNNRVTLASLNDNAYYSYFGQVGNQQFLDANAGLVLYGEKLVLSLSSSQLFNNNVTINEKASLNKHVRHYFGAISYVIFSNNTLKVEPVITFRKVGNTPINVDLTGRFTFKKYGWASAGMRGSGRTMLGLGTNVFNHFKIGYVFEFGIGKTAGFGNGTHEIQLAYRFGRSKKGNKVEENNDFVPLPSNTNSPAENN